MFQVIDIMERQSNGTTENGSPPLYDHSPPNGMNGDHQNGVNTTAPNSALLQTGIVSVKQYLSHTDHLVWVDG